MIVVISQSGTHQPKLRDHEEQLVAHLLLEARCEVTLVTDLAHLDSDNTGLLCLEGIKGSMLVLSWHEGPLALEHLTSHGIQGRLVDLAEHEGQGESTGPPALGPGIYDPMQRSIHHLTMDLERTMADYERVIKLAHQETQVQTVSLGISPPPANPAEPVPSETQSTSPTPTSAAPETVNPVPRRSDLQDDQDDSNDLDSLLDELDETLL